MKFCNICDYKEGGKRELNFCEHCQQWLCTYCFFKSIHLKNLKEFQEKEGK
jgi:hypothetical protein